MRPAARVAAFAAPVVALAVGLWIGWGRGAAPDLSPHDAAIEAAAKEFRVDPDLLRGLVAAESGGDPRAHSAKDARGLLQLLPATAEEQAARLGMPWAGADSLYEPAVNLRLGAAFFASLLARFGGEEAFAVAAYNAGPEPVKRWRVRAADASAHDVVMREGYAETKKHVLRVLRYRDVYRSRS